MKKQLTFKDDKSNKFWQIETAGNSYTVNYGKIGTTGQTQTKTFGSEAECEKAAEKLVNEKLKKGYVEGKSSQKSKKPKPNPILEAKELIKNYKFSAEELEQLKKFGKGDYFDGYFNRLFSEINANVLSECFNHYVGFYVEKKDPKNEDIKKGATLLLGLPHLPPSLEWPKGHFFFAQINLTDFHSYDIENILPATGMIYIFLDNSDGCEVFYYNGSTEHLTITEYPENVIESLDEDGYGIEEFTETTKLIDFYHHIVFYTRKGVYDPKKKGILDLIPSNLKKRLEKMCEASLEEIDYHTSSIFGRPTTWQGEFDSFTQDEDKYRRNKEASENHVLLIQASPDPFDGHIHVWINKEKSLQKETKLNMISKLVSWSTYSGS